jgi:cellulose synthase/poly-beta-1,6-N-acetylglucosamine synthase-like glycosyltransferase
MENALFWLAAATLALYLAALVAVLRGNRSIPFLADVTPLPKHSAIAVSVLIPARNEERNIRAALRSILAQDHRPIEFIVVDDRSTDRTGAILDELSREDPRLKVVRVTELPPGWLGKNHALHLAAQSATGDLLLFTDADIVMRADTVRRAVSHLEENGIDHLTLTPVTRMPGLFLQLFMGTFVFFFTFFVRPWRVRDPRSSCHIGIGAFNLVRASAYQAVGGHRAIRMRPDDDLKLGKLLKIHRRRQELLYGRGMVEVEWYATLGELIEGLMKNMFAGVEYRISAVVGSTLAILVLLVWPYAGMVIPGGAASALDLASVIVIQAVFWDTMGFAGLKRWSGLVFPVTSILFLYILWKSMLRTLLDGGIRWRGTHYPLAELRANAVRIGRGEGQRSVGVTAGGGADRRRR